MMFDLKRFGLAVVGAFAFSASAVSATTIPITTTNGVLGVTGSVTATISTDPFDLSLVTASGAVNGYAIDVTVENNDDSLAGITDSTITRVLLEFDPSVSFVGFIDDGAGNWALKTGTTLPPENSLFYDFCLGTDTGSCSGGNPTTGVTAGNSDTFTIIVSAVSASPVPSLIDAALRFQEVDTLTATGLSAKGWSCDPTTDPDCFPDTSGEVPLPAAAWLLIGGVGILGGMKRFKRKAA